MVRSVQSVCIGSVDAAFYIMMTTWQTTTWQMMIGKMEVGSLSWF